MNYCKIEYLYIIIEYLKYCMPNVSYVTILKIEIRIFTFCERNKSRK